MLIICQDPAYHAFADQRALFGIPNFWNVVTNVAFLLAALFAVRARAFTEWWERAAYMLLVAGVALTAAGSTYYHLNPNSQTLVWDRLPMTLVFMSLFATAIGERLSMRAGKLLLLPLIAAGLLSVAYWRLTGDLLPYALVQFVPMLVIPALLLFRPSRYTHQGGVWGMLAFYALAKLAELLDRPLAALVSTGGHPWKHVAAAAAIVCYAVSVSRRQCRNCPTSPPISARSSRAFSGSSSAACASPLPSCCAPCSPRPATQKDARSRDCGASASASPSAWTTASGSSSTS